MSVLSIIGPTASGKTALAVEVALNYNGEIIGADASQVYRGLDIGTGKATPDELGGVQHHLIDVVEPDGHFDVAEYIRLADAAIEDVRRRGKRPILCGGTGLYLRGLIRGLCQAPPSTPEIKAALLGRIADGELPQVYRELQTADPIAAERINPNDAQRIERALGVFLTSGKPLSAWQAEHRPLFGELAVELGYLNRAELRLLVGDERAEQKIGECARQMGLLSDDSIRAVMAHQRAHQEPLGQFFVKRGYFSRGELGQVLASHRKHNAQFLKAA